MSDNQFKVMDDPPTEKRMVEVLGATYEYLEGLRNFLRKEIGETVEEWKYYGVKNGWILKTFLKKRNMFFIGIYEGYFRITFVFGDRAVQSVMESEVTEDTKRSLQEARKYAEGRGISFEVGDDSHLSDIEHLIKIKSQK